MILLTVIFDKFHVRFSTALANSAAAPNLLNVENRRRQRVVEKYIKKLSKSYQKTLSSGEGNESSSVI